VLVDKFPCNIYHHFSKTQNGISSNLPLAWANFWVQWVEQHERFLAGLPRRDLAFGWSSPQPQGDHRISHHLLRAISQCKRAWLPLSCRLTALSMYCFTWSSIFSFERKAEICGVPLTGSYFSRTQQWFSLNCKEFSL